MSSQDENEITSESKDVVTSESASNRKRSFDGPKDEYTSKKSSFTFLQLKLLIPSVNSGAVIGKGGETITNISKTYNVTVKMSKGSEYFPGTTDRVALINGSLAKVNEAFESMMKSIIDNSRTKPKDDGLKVRILIPNSTAGMIIGKGGKFIKHIEDLTGAHLNVSNKDESNFDERILSVSGSFDNVLEAVKEVTGKIMDDPNGSSNSNLHYSDMYSSSENISHDVGPYSMGNSQYDIQQRPPFEIQQRPPFESQQRPPFDIQQRPPFDIQQRLMNSLPSPEPSTMTPMENLRAALTFSGYDGKAIEDISQAVIILSNYGLLGLGLGAAGSKSLAHLINVMHGNSSALGNNSSVNHSSANHSIGNPMPNLQSPTIRNILGLSNGNQKDISREVQVNESIVGYIIGSGGKGINDIQKITGALINVSKKGVFAPDTQNRIVTVSGKSNSVESAIEIIEKRVSQEERKRVSSLL